jgi:hypothetical protein
MRKSKADVEDDFGDLHFLSGDDVDQIDVFHGIGKLGQSDAERARPARQRLELRNEQRSLRRQLSDWDDYTEDFDTDL